MLVFSAGQVHAASAIPFSVPSRVHCQFQHWESESCEGQTCTTVVASCQVPLINCGVESENSKVEYTTFGSDDVQVPFLLPPLRSATLSPTTIGHSHDTAGYFLSWLFLTKPPVATQVDAAQRANSVF